MNDSELAKREPEPTPEQPAGGVAEEAPPSEETPAATGQTQPQAPAKTAARGGLAIGVIALLLAIAAGAGAYLAWQELQAIRVSQQEDTQQLTARTDDLQREIQQLPNALSQELADMRQEQATQREMLNALRTAVNRRDRSDWVVAEVEYLLRIANDRLRLHHDVGTALTALTAADERLHELGNPAFLPVREQVAREVAALRAAVEPDIPGLSLVLNSLAERVEQLPLSLQYHGGRGQAPAATDAAAPADAVHDWRAFLRAVWEDLKGLVVIRRNQGTVGAMLPPDQEFFLRQNLRLKLETAQLATLQRNEPAYQSNLHGARELLVTYFDQDSGAVTAMLAELDRLAQAQINPELPDISGSLRVLRKTVSTPSDTDEERAPAGADQP